MDILKIALDAGMQIGDSDCVDQNEARSVMGSLQTLQRFADALHETAKRESRSVRMHEALIDCPAIRSLLESDPLMFV